MIGLARFWLWLALGALPVCSTLATTNDSPSLERNYRVIIDRNAFGLKPPPPLPTNTAAATAPKDEILLTGIKSLGGLRAYFQTKAPAGKNPEYYSLGPEEKKNGLEVLEINVSDKSVRVRNAGVESVMTFASNGVKAPAAPTTPTAAPPAPGTAPNTATASVATPSPFTAAGAGVRNIPSRLPPRGGNAGMAPGGTAPNMEVNQAPARPNPYAAEQDVLLMELQKRVNPSVVFPPTPGMSGPGGPGLPGQGPPGLPGR